METSTAQEETSGPMGETSGARAETSGAATIATLIPAAAEKFADHVAARYKRDGAWHDVTYSQLATTVDELALGLIEIGIEAGERVCILSNTRPEWSYAEMAITATGAVAVPIYQTNSPEECEWVIRDAGACAIFCEDAEQLRKIETIADRVPQLRTVIVFEASEQSGPLGAISVEQLRQRGQSRDAAELSARRKAVRPEDTFTIIYTSGTTGPPKGCVLTHGNYRAILDMVEERGILGEIAAGSATDDNGGTGGYDDRDAEGEASGAGEASGEGETGGEGESEAQGDVVYLYLPLAHSFALLLQLVVFDLGVTLAYFGGDTKQIIVELAEVKPTYLPSVPRIFEKIYTLVSANADPELLAKATQVGMKVRELEVRGEPIPKELEQPFAEAEEKLFKNVRAAFGGRVREAVTGAAPIAKEILEFFYACGVPVMEGYGMTETATAATTSRPEMHRFGSVGKPLPGVEVRIADDGELLIKGANIFSGYYGRQDSDFGTVVDGWLHTGDLGRIDEDGFVYIIGRKKDIIITAGGKNLTPANIENEMKQCRWVSQAVMHGDRRPYPVLLITLDEEEIVPWAREHGLPEEIAKLAHEPQAHALIQAELDRVNERYAQVERVKRFAVLEHDLSQETGELTPTLKVKRNVVEEKYAELLDELYAG